MYGVSDYLFVSTDEGKGTDFSVVMDIPPTNGSNFTYRDSLRKSDGTCELPIKLKYSNAAGSLNTEKDT